MPIAKYYKEHKKLVTLGLILLAILILAGFVLHGRSNQPKYLTGKVDRGDITAAVQATGTINPVTTVPVGSYVSGTVQYIFADFNTHVHAGQVLAQLDPSIYLAQVATARGNLENLKATVPATEAAITAGIANVSKLQANLDYSRVNARRNENLFKQGIISVDQNDLTQSNLAQQDAAVRQAQAEVNQTKAQLAEIQAQIRALTGTLEQAETNLRYTTIVSPIDGIVVARNVTVGQSVAATLQAPNVFTIAQDLRRMQVYASTDESDTGSISVGTEVSFQVDAYPNEIFHGRVSAIRLNATTIQNVVTYNTVIDFENPQEKLLPGETAYVTIPTGHVSNTIEIPNAALRFTPDLPRNQIQNLYQEYKIPSAAVTSHLGGWQVVWKLGAEKKLFPVAIKVGITDYAHTQLVAGDLSEGDVLVTGQEAGPNAGTTQTGPPRFGGPRR